jgi:transcription elongation factor GreB
MLGRMNKAFTKEDESPEPAIVPPRASLPPGTPNYVTARGLELLQAELSRLDDARTKLDRTIKPEERAIQLGRLAAQRNALEERIAAATLVNIAKQPRSEVRFGASVDVRMATGQLRTYRIVGVDEADPTAGLVAFVSPLARALLGRSVGEIVAVRTPRGEDELEVVRIAYDMR